MITAIRLDRVSCRRGGRTVLNELELELHYGEVLALVGPNGAGKSTVLAAITGDVAIEAGRVLIDDRPRSDWPRRELSRRLAMLTQSVQLSFPFGVRAVVQMGRFPWRRTPEEHRDDAAVTRALAETDTTELTGRSFSELSGGERARVALARVLAQETPIVLLDEPTAALDLSHQEAVMRLARRLSRQGIAVAVVLHDLTLAGAYADRIALLDAGSLVALGTPTEVLSESRVAAVYRLPVRVRVDDSGRPVVIPRRDVDRITQDVDLA